MTILLVIPVLLSALLLAAHFLRAGNLVAVILCLLAPSLMLVRRQWVPRVMQGALAYACIVWILTTLDIVRIRMAHGVPWTTAGIILGVVALWTAGSALLFETRTLRMRYRNDG